MQRIVLSQQQKDKLNALLSNYSSYARFSRTKKDAFDYTATLGVRVCPYCNINFTYTVYEKAKPRGSGKRCPRPVLRPDLDHFAPKSVASQLSLAQENLIPSCQQCNSRVKAQIVFSSSTHIQPFVDDFDSIKRFTIKLNGPNIFSRDNFEIGFANRSSAKRDVARADRTIKDLKLNARYQYHKEEIVDLFKKASFYHRGKVEEIRDLLQLRDLRRHLLFSEMKQINESPLSKLRRDTLELILRK